MTTREILVFGASGHGKVVADVALAAGYERVVFGDDDPSKPRLLLAAVVSPISDRVVVFGVPCRVVSEV